MATTRRALTWAGLVVVLLGRGAAAGAPAGGTMPVVEYAVTDASSGRRLFTAWAWTETTTGDPHSVTVLADTVFARGGESVVRTRFTRDWPPRCLSWERTLKDARGAVLSTTHARWGAQLFPLLTTPFPPDTYPLEAPMGYVVTQLGLGARRTVSFYTMLGETLTQIDLRVDGRDAVRVAAGTFDCYRIRMQANARSLFPGLPGFLKPLLSFFIPTYTLWLTVDQPQLLVQFRGQMGPPGSPEILVRLLAVRR